MKRISYLVSIVFLFSLLILLPTKAEGIDDHLHYSINLVWDIADESQKYHQSVDVVNQSSKLYPKYNFSIQTSSVDYGPEDMEFTLPLSLFTKRDLTELGITEKYKEDKIFPIEIAIDSGNNDDWYYIEDKENDKLIIKNKNTIYAGTNAVFQVRYDLNELYTSIYDMSIGKIQAIGKCKPTSETPGVDLPIEEHTSNEITYQIDTGLSALYIANGYGNVSKFEPYNKLNGYRYYKVTLITDVLGTQPFDFAFSFDFKDTNGEIVGPEENVSKNIVITDIDNYKPISPTFEYHTRSATSGTDIIVYSNRKTEFYVRYKDDSSNEDKLDITVTATGIDNDGYNHISPDNNDILSTDISFSHQWVNYPNKPIGEIMKGPTEPNITDRLSAMLPTNSSYKKYIRMFFSADKAVIGRSENNNSKLVITDTGIIPDDNAPIIDYEVIFLRIYFNNIGIYNNITGTITPINTNAINKSFNSITIDFSKDGNIWDETITIDLEKDITNYGYYDVEVDKLYDKSYKNFRITFDGIKENVVLNDKFVEFNIRVSEYSKEYLERQDLDTYTNWAEFELYSNNKRDYLVKDWSKFTLTPVNDYSKSNISKQITSANSNTDEKKVFVNFKVSSKVDLATLNTTDNIELSKISSHHLQKIKDLYDEWLTITSVDKAVFYDLLPPGYTFNSASCSIHINGVIMYNSSLSESFSAEVVDNYLDTGRTLVIFKLDISKINLDKIILDNIVNFECNIRYNTYIYWNDLVYYQNERNFVAFQMESGMKLPNGYPDDGNPDKSNQNLPGFSDLMTDSGKLAFCDINGDGDTTTPNTLYTQVMVSPNVAIASQSGITKHIMGDSGEWTDLDITDINKEYKYRVRVSTAQTTTLSDLIVFDTLEEAANTNEWEGEVPWKGTFKSVDTSWLLRHGFDPVVYYSTATVDKLDYNIITGRENNPWINDTAIWSTDIPSDLSKVTAIAVDCRKMKDGSDAKLENGQGIEFEIKMTAPSEYPTSKNPKMIYAYNRPAYSCKITPAYSATPEYYTDIGHRVRIYLPTKISINVKKTWVGEDNLKPREITVKLLANGQDTGKTITLSELNNWTNTFENLDDIENDEKIIYTIEEIEVQGYRTEITGDAETGFEIINTQLPKEGWLKIKKTVAPQYEGLINRTNP